MTYLLTFTDSGQTGTTTIDAPGMGAAVAIFRRDHPGADLLTIDDQHRRPTSTSNAAGSGPDGGRWASIAPPEGFHEKTLTALDQAFPAAERCQYSTYRGDAAASVSVSVFNGASAMLKKVNTLRSRLFAAIADRVARSMADYLLSHPSHRDLIRDQVAADLARAMHTDDGFHGPSLKRALIERLTADKDIRSQLFTDISDHWYTHHTIDESDVIEKIADWHQDSINADWLKREVAENLCESLVDSFDGWDGVESAVSEEIIGRMNITVEASID